jgi:DNA-binding MarR family transcriptional regulator/GNAT superfamily N-acetyltransferase
MDDAVPRVRAFTRYYTGAVGALQEGLLRSPYSLTEARVLFELGRRESMDAIALRRMLDIDAGYLSRMLARFEADKLLTRERSEIDGRRQVIRLTAQGRAAYTELDDASASEIAQLLDPLTAEDRRELVQAMDTIERILTERPRPQTVVLRPPRAGDLGWVVELHGRLYADEYGWDATFEALVARIVADFAERRDPVREAGWIAEVDGERVGCVICVRDDDETARLRILLVDPAARGLGVGGRLVEECLRFAKQAGYRRMTLWTNDVLAAARRIYERAGFELEEQSEHRSFGKDLVGQTWSRDL